MQALKIPGCLLAALLLGNSIFATTVNVSIGGSFSPDPVVINTNDSVKWTWASNDHNSFNTNGLWDSGIHNAGFTFTHSFPTPGEFYYTCTVHGFWGVISVLGQFTTNVNILDTAFDPPAVTIRPNDTVKWTWVTDFHNTASTSSIWDSGIYNNGFAYEFKFTNTGTFPYSCVVHQFTGVVTVQAATIPPSVLSQPRFIPPSTFQFNYSSSSGASYVVQRSANLSNWLSLKTNVASGSSVLFQDTNTSPQDFYRVFQMSP